LFRATDKLLSAAQFDGTLAPVQRYFAGVRRLFMPSKVRIAIDAMGGDVGRPVVIPGAAMALRRHPETEFLLVGNRALIEPELERQPALKAASRVIHTDVAVRMEDKPS